jgi:hypothetical protein
MFKEDGTPLTPQDKRLLTDEERRRRRTFVMWMVRGVPPEDAAVAAGYPKDRAESYAFRLLQTPYIRIRIVEELQIQGIAWRGMLGRAKAILYEQMNPRDKTLTHGDRRDAAKAVLAVLARGGAPVAEEAGKEDLSEQELRRRAAEIILGEPVIEIRAEAVQRQIAAEAPVLPEVEAPETVLPVLEPS